jgi:four helix bundle protein
MATSAGALVAMEMSDVRLQMSDFRRRCPRAAVGQSGSGGHDPVALTPPTRYEFSVHNFRRLQAWRRARGLVLRIYRLSEQWPARERFGMVAQARRAAVSIPSNIAEGAGRGSDREFARFMRISMGSISELETLLWLAGDLDYTPESDLRDVIAECSELRRMLHRLAGRLGSPPDPTPDPPAVTLTPLV